MHGAVDLLGHRRPALHADGFDALFHVMPCAVVEITIRIGRIQFLRIDVYVVAKASSRAPRDLAIVTEQNAGIAERRIAYDIETCAMKTNVVGVCRREP